jgi:hypothetical protein
MGKMIINKAIKAVACFNDGFILIPLKNIDVDARISRSMQGGKRGAYWWYVTLLPTKQTV